MPWSVRAVPLPDGDRPADLWIDATGCLAAEPVPGAEPLPGRYVAPGLVDAPCPGYRFLGEPFDQPGRPATLVTYQDDPREDLTVLSSPSAVLIDGIRVR